MKNQFKDGDFNESKEIKGLMRISIKGKVWINL